MSFGTIERAPICRVVTLHVRHLHDAAGAIAGGRNLVATGDVQRQRLFAQDMQSGVQRADGKLGMEGIGRRDDQRVEIAAEQALEIRVQHLDAVAGTYFAAHAW